MRIVGQDTDASLRIVTIAHRGGIIPGIPENSLLGFKKSIDIGVDVIEIDLRATRDDEIIIMHDESIDRTTNGRGKVVELTIEELRQFDLGIDQQIPTFKELLSLVKGSKIKLLLDIKVSGNLDKKSIIELIESFEMMHNVILGVRTLEDLNEFHQLNSDIRTLGFISTLDQLELFMENRINIIRIWPEWIESHNDIIDKIHQKGIPVWITAGNLPDDEVHVLIERGVNGIIHDSPELLVGLLK